MSELEEILWKLLKEEGITKELVDCVDLDIEFTPVIPIKGMKPMEVVKLEGGLYRIPNFTMVGLNITPEELKIMRARYLINRRR